MKMIWLIIIFGLIFFVTATYALQGGSSNSFSTTAPDYKFYHIFNYSGQISDIPNDENGNLMTEFNQQDSNMLYNWTIQSNRMSAEVSNIDGPATKICMRTQEERVNFSAMFHFNLSGTGPINGRAQLWGDNASNCGNSPAGAGNEIFMFKVGTSEEFQIRKDQTNMVSLDKSAFAVRGQNYSALISVNYTGATGCSLNLTIYNITNSSGILTYTDVGSQPHFVCPASLIGLRSFFFRMNGDSASSGSVSIGIDELVMWNYTTVANAQVRPTTTSAVVDKFPQFNTTFFNDTSLVQNDGTNFTANISSDIGLSFCQFMDNQSLPNGAINFFNKSVSGTFDQCSQNYTIRLANGAVINFSIRINDTSNNINQTSTILTIADSTSPIITNISIKHTLMNTTNTNLLRITCNDADSFLKKMNFSLLYNLTTTKFTRFIDIPTETTGGCTGSCISRSLVVESGSRNYIWNYTLFGGSETAREGNYNLTQVGCLDNADNYIENSTDNNFTGIKFLMDTPPTINARSPSNSSTMKSLNVTLNVTITETNPSYIILFINGILNQTISYVGDGTTKNAFDSIELLDLTDYNWSISLNTTFGTWTNSSNFSFTVDTTPPSSSSGGAGCGGGGGGGPPPQIIIINKTANVTISNCNFNSKCEAKNGEDPFNCPSDCKINTNYLFCDDPTQKCIKDIFNPENKTFRFVTVLAILAGIYLGATNIKKR